MSVKWSFPETLLTYDGFIVSFKNELVNEYFKILLVSIHNMEISINVM